MAITDITCLMAKTGSPVWLGSNEAFISCSRNLFGDYFIYAHYTLCVFGRILRSEMRTYTSRNTELWYTRFDGGNHFEGHGELAKIERLVKLAESLGYRSQPVEVQRVLRHAEFGFEYIQLHAPYDNYLFVLDGPLDDPLSSETNWSLLSKRFYHIPGIIIPNNLRLRLATAALDWLMDGGEVVPIIGTFIRPDAALKQHALL